MKRPVESFDRPFCFAAVEPLLVIVRYLLGCAFDVFQPAFSRQDH
jgi:hypothetical protein